MIWKLTDAKAKILEDVCNRVRKMTGGPGIRVVNGPNGITVSLDDTAASKSQTAPTPYRLAKVNSSSAVNGAIRWKYTIELGYWDMSTAASSGGTWTKTSGDAVLYAFNSAEDMNTFTGNGVIGTGNTVASSTGVVNAGSCNLLAIPNNAYVVVIPRGMDSSGQIYYTIINFTNSAEIP